MLFSIFALSGTLTAQENMPRRPKRVTYEQMTEKMVKELQLNEKQQKKVAKLNKKYKTLIEGEQREMPNAQRPPMGERPNGRPGGGPSGGMGGHGGGMPGGFGGGMPGGGFGEVREAECPENSHRRNHTTTISNSKNTTRLSVRFCQDNSTRVT